jgi:hypothetical protein
MPLRQLDQLRDAISCALRDGLVKRFRTRRRIVSNAEMTVKISEDYLHTITAVLQEDVV